MVFNSQNVGRCIQHFLYCSFVLSLPLFSVHAHIIGMHYCEKPGQKLYAENVCWFSNIFSQTKYSPLIPFRLKQATDRNIYANVKIFIEFLHQIYATRNNSTIWLFFISFHFTFVCCMIFSRSKRVYRHKNRCRIHNVSFTIIVNIINT